MDERRESKRLAGGLVPCRTGSPLPVDSDRLRGELHAAPPFGAVVRRYTPAADDPAASERVRVRSRQLVCESEESLRSATEPASSDVGLDRSLHGKRVDEVCTIASSESFPQMARREEVAEPEVEHDGALGRAPERVQPEQHIGRDLRTLAQPEPLA